MTDTSDADSWFGDVPAPFDDDDDDDSPLDALVVEVPSDHEPEDSLDIAGEAPTDPEESEEDEDETVMTFTVTNPPGTVTVTAFPNGCPMQIDLETRAVDMTESQLAEEILLIAKLAEQNALAGQHLIMAAIMNRAGMDQFATRTYLEHDLGLPTVESVLSDKAQIFATRYEDHED